MNVNVTIPKKAMEYLDLQARKQYASLSSVARAYLLRAVHREIVVKMRREGYSIRMISERTEIPYVQVMDVLADTQVDEESENDDQEQDRILGLR